LARSVSTTLTASADRRSRLASDCRAR
jgi:hypothetical protein